MRHRVTIEPDEDGIYIAEVPNLPGCLSQGRTRDEALSNIKEPIVAYLENLKEHGERGPIRQAEITVEEFKAANELFGAFNLPPPLTTR